jgi:hypothetical protein
MGTLVVVGESATELGAMLQVTPAGAPEHAKDTVPLKLLGITDVTTVRLKVAVCPAATVAEFPPKKANGGATFRDNTGETVAL